jgi:hypothetical protein
LGWTFEIDWHSSASHSISIPVTYPVHIALPILLFTKSGLRIPQFPAATVQLLPTASMLTVFNDIVNFPHMITIVEKNSSISFARIILLVQLVVAPNTGVSYSRILFVPAVKTAQTSSLSSGAGSERSRRYLIMILPSQILR